MSNHAFVPGLASNLVKYAEQLVARGDHPEALRAASEAVEIYEELASDPALDRSLLAQALVLRAKAHAGTKRFEEALAGAQRAASLYESALDEVGDTPVLREGLLEALGLVGAVQLRMGWADAALSTADRVIAMVERQRRRQRRRNIVTFRLLRGGALVSLGRVDEAVASVGLAVADSTEADLPELLAAGMTVLSSAAETIRGLSDAMEVEADISRLAGEILRRSGASESTGFPGTAEAISLYRRIAEDSPDSALPALAGSLQELSSQMLEQGDLRGAASAAAEVVEINRLLADKNPDSYSTHLARAVAEHALVQYALATERGDLTGLESAIADLTATAARIPSGEGTLLHSVRAHLAYRVALLSGDPRSLDVAIEAATEATRAPAEPDPEVATLLAEALAFRHDMTGSLEDLDRAVDVCRTVLSASPTKDPDRPALLALLATNLQRRYDAVGELADLDEAVELTREAIAASSPEHPTHAHALRGLSSLLLDRYSVTGSGVDLDTVIAASRRALDATPVSDAETRAAILASLAQALGIRSEFGGDPHDLDEAVAVARMSVDIIPAAHPDALTAHYWLGQSLFARFQAQGQASDLDAAIAATRNALDATPDTSPNRAFVLGDLAGMMLARAQLSGQLADIDEAIADGRVAIDMTPHDSPVRSVLMSRLNEALSARYEHTADSADRDALIETMRRYLAEPHVDDPDVARILARLSDILQERHHFTDRLDDLDAAIQAARQAVGRTPTEDPLRNHAVSSLARALVTKARTSDDKSALNEAIALATPALLSTREGVPDLVDHLTVLGSALQARFEMTADPVDQASLFANRFEQTSDPEDLAFAINGFWMIARSGRVRPVDRVRAAHQVGLLAMSNGRLGEALDGFRLAIELLPQILSDRAWHESVLFDAGRLTELASDAAACALTAGDPAQALSLLEQGRWVLIEQALGSRDDLKTLWVQAPDLADRLSTLGRQLDAADEDIEPSVRTETASEFDELISRIRAMPGMADFLRPPDVGDFITQATAGSIIVINISDYRCDAFALTRAGINVIPLHNLNRDSVVARAGKFLANLTPDYRPMNDRLEQETVLSETLSWLWHTVVGPILEALGLDRAPEAASEWPRVWWVPTGAMALFPLHAAGHETGALDCVVSSYAATVTALARARATQPRTGSTESNLVIRPQPLSGPSDLPGADREVRAIAEFLPSARLLTGAEATLEHTVAAMPDAQILHFAGHSVYNSTDPAKSGLLLSDGQISLGTLASEFARRHESPRLAFLSACTTSKAPPVGTGEVANFGMLLQQIGYRHIISTLWEVDDRAYADIAQDFYGRMAANGFNVEDSAVILHGVARRFRQRFPHIPSLWAAHIHTGP